jgi:hypothetical protein
MTRATAATTLAIALSCAPGCASRSTTSATSSAASTRTDPAPPACDPDRDRAAIRAMAGEFRVSFAFAETEVLTPGYERHEPYRASAREVVEILDDSDERIVLQHVLLLPGVGGKVAAMKHWRQDWTFEDSELVEYRAGNTWERRLLSPDEVRCTWSQAVFEVTAGPRYESIGRWEHEAASSSWTSRETWRPLPRREHTKRSDYDVLVAVNRHVIGADGWTHEQDNFKLVVASDRRLVRERGENRYVRTTLDDAEVARAYLRETEPTWRAVRQAWGEVLATQSRFSVASEVDGKPLYEFLFPIADPAKAMPPDERARRARAAIQRFIVPASVASVSRVHVQEHR